MGERGVLSAAAGWGSLALVGLLALGGAAARPGGILLGAPGAAGVLLVCAGLGLLAWLARRATAAKACVGFAPLVLLLLTWPQLPGLRALSGAPLLALALAGAAAVLAQSRPRLPRAAFFPVIFALYAMVAARVQLQVGPEGDEPHYLMVADSLLRDGDLDLEPDYALGRYMAFHPDPLEPHYRVRGKGGEIYSLHAVGLSLLVLPAYALGGYPAVSFLMALLAALLARELRELVRRWTAEDALAEGVGWTLALSPPLVSYAGLVFTEIPAALIVAAALRHGREPSGRSLARSLALGAAVAFLPWLNVRYAPLALILLAYVLAGGPRRAVAAAVVLPSLASAAALVSYHLALYGFWDPRRVYGRRPEISLGGIPEGLQGLLLDQEFGLLAYAPVFALAIPGLAALLREGWRHAATLVGLAAATILIAASWPMWRGGFNPPARFLVPALPVLALGVAAWLRRGLLGGPALLIGWGLFTGLAGAWEPRLVHRDRQGSAPLFRECSGAEEWTRLLPAYVLADEEPDRHRLALVWAAVLALAAVRWGRPGPTAAGFTAATMVLSAAAGLASRVSDGRTEGRPATRLVGRPCLAVPGWAWLASAPGRWGPEDLAWGPVYEPHRHPQGALLGGRLVLRPGRYRLRVDAEEPPTERDPPFLEILGEGGPRRVRRSGFERAPGGLEAPFEVGPEDRPVTLLLRGGGPLILRSLELRSAQPFAGPPV